jgi:hypothetical protein
MVLTREGKEKLVLDLYNEGKITREIAQIAHMPFRDIGFIIYKKEKEQESKEGQTRQSFLSTQAYKHSCKHYIIKTHVGHNWNR